LFFKLHHDFSLPENSWETFPICGNRFLHCRLRVTEGEWYNLQKKLQISIKLIHCFINIADKDLQMQARSELEPKLMSVLKVHRELTPDCDIFRHARGSQSGIQGFPWKQESITLHWFPAFAGTSLDYRLRTAGMTALIYIFFMQHLG
jgi:hypothetical protein